MKALELADLLKSSAATLADLDCSEPREVGTVVDLLSNLFIEKAEQLIEDHAADERTLREIEANGPLVAPTPGVLDEIEEEQARQVEKWGEQNHPNSFLDLMADAEQGLARQISAVAVASWYGVPTEQAGKAACQQRFAAGAGTWADVLIEEVAEAIGAMAGTGRVAAADPAALRGELVQVAAVAASWIGSIDRAKRARIAHDLATAPVRSDYTS